MAWKAPPALERYREYRKQKDREDFEKWFEETQAPKWRKFTAEREAARRAPPAR